ncbi:TetR family transcriptional regulator [Microlunatus elymi]|uniref:TetR family transcriptional regulator n=1 Tax=Microlunatus elymi TaxID=2596828 RepID=A0A516Q0D0_9ACTN|nr:TetR/AcrR family transcriptional regulator [Microlunatus elymi]QDP96896.1 TetR family transcriptional regulator [Microlunatus elymi]
MSTSLREKKRELLRSTIEKAAVALVLEHGYDNVTVDMICEQSMASQRTFFNYFGSKESAILGPPPPAPSPEIIEAFVHHREGDVLSDLTRMMTRALNDAGEVDLDLWRDRRQIIRTTPELMRSQAEKIATKDSEIAALVLRRLRVQHGLPEVADSAAAESENPTEQADSDDRLIDEARLIVNLWWGIARHAMKLWAEKPETTPQQITDDLLTLLARIKEA